MKSYNFVFSFDRVGTISSLDVCDILDLPLERVNDLTDEEVVKAVYTYANIIKDDLYEENLVVSRVALLEDQI